VREACSPAAKVNTCILALGTAKGAVLCGELSFPQKGLALNAPGFRTAAALTGQAQEVMAK
jgi:hypothetical protein